MDLIEQESALHPTISIRTYHIVIGVALASAVLSFLWRLLQRYLAGHLFSRVDAALGFATTCLIAASAVAYKGSETFYLIAAIQRNPDFILDVSIPDLNLSETEAGGLLPSLTVLNWTAIFLVKASVLLIVHPVVSRIRWLHGIHCGMIACNALAWAVLFAAAVALNPFSIATLESYDHGILTLYTMVVVLLSALDIATFLMIVILFWILAIRITTIASRHKKFVYALMLSILLSVGCAAVRLSRIYHLMSADFIWGLTWQYIEASVSMSGVSLFTACCSIEALVKASPDSISQQHRRQVSQPERRESLLKPTKNANQAMDEDLPFIIPLAVLQSTHSTFSQDIEMWDIPR